MTKPTLDLPNLVGQEVEDAKQHLRILVRKARKKRSSSALEEAGAALREQIWHRCEGLQAVACFVSTNAEPPTLPAIEALRAGGIKVLLPKLGPGLSRAWAYYAGREDLAQLAPGRPLEPSTQTLGPEELAAVDLVICPALAIDGQGNRLGQGGGWYDRALPLARPQTPIYGLCFDEEFQPNLVLPHNDMDMPVTGVITPERCFELGGAGR